MATNSTRTTRTTVTAGTAAMNGVKAIGDLGVVPGASHIVDGDVRGGLLYAVGGLAARALFGPIGWLAVGADSFSVSVSGKHLHQHFFNVEVEKARD